MDSNLTTTKQALLDAAERLFSANGYAGVGIRQIADEAGANIASIKYHFGGKSDLYLATVREVMCRRESLRTWDLLAEPPTDSHNAAARLVCFIRSFVDHLLCDDRAESCTNLIVRESLRPTEAMDAVVRDYLQPRMKALMQTINVLVPDSAADGAIAARAVMAQMLYHRIFRSIISRLEGESSNSATRTADGIARFVLRGMGCAEASIDQAVRQADELAEASHEHNQTGVLSR